jgi:hypothetical protein
MGNAIADANVYLTLALAHVVGLRITLCSAPETMRCGPLCRTRTRHHHRETTLTRPEFWIIMELGNA